MAEVIGILSSAVTFMEAGGKVFKFLNAVKNTPRRIEILREDLKSMVSLVTNLKTELDRLGRGTGIIPLCLIPLADLHELRHLMQQSKENINDLAAALTQFIARPQERQLERSWRALKMHLGAGEINEKLQRLERLRISLQLWLDRQTFRLSAEHWYCAFPTVMCEITNGLLRYSKQSISANLHNFDVRLSHIHSQVSSQIASSDASLIATIQRSEGRIVETLEQQIRMLRRSLEPEVLAHTTQTSIQDLHATNLPCEQLLPRIMCTCRARPASSYSSFGSIYVKINRSDFHQARCPLHQRSIRKLAIGLRTTVCHFIFSASFGTRGISLGPNLKLPGRPVDRNVSHAFKFMRSSLKLYNDYVETGWDEREALKTVCEALTTGLTDIFTNQQGYATDEDECGRTLLSVSDVENGIQ